MKRPLRVFTPFFSSTLTHSNSTGIVTLTYTIVMRFASVTALALSYLPRCFLSFSPTTFPSLPSVCACMGVHVITPVTSNVDV